MRALHLIQLAGGSGSRACTSPRDVPKQFRRVGSRLLLRISLDEFQQLADPQIGLASVTVTVADAWCDVVGQDLTDLRIPVQLAPAGITRTASTWSAVRAMTDTDLVRPTDLVAVHDAARPFASVKLLSALVLAAATDGAAVPGLPVPDTIMRRTDKGSAHYLRREELVAVQTPQVFRWDIFRDAHAWAAETETAFTDDGSLLAARGHAPTIVDGEQGNWKVTTSDDWQRAVEVLSSRP